MNISEGNDFFQRHAADGISRMLEAADGGTEKAVLLQIVSNTAALALSDYLPAHLIAQWLRESAALFDSMAARQQGGLN